MEDNLNDVEVDLTSLDRKVRDELLSFRNNDISMSLWPKWFAINARELARSLDRGVMKELRTDPFNALRSLNEEFDSSDMADLAGIEPLKRDPQEDDSTLKSLIDEVGDRAMESLGLNETTLDTGDCHRIWRIQKAMLYDEYGIDWKTPAEMNPDIVFD